MASAFSTGLQCSFHHTKCPVLLPILSWSLPAKMTCPCPYHLAFPVLCSAMPSALPYPPSYPMLLMPYSALCISLSFFQLPWRLHLMTEPFMPTKIQTLHAKRLQATGYRPLALTIFLVAGFRSPLVFFCVQVIQYLS